MFEGHWWVSGWVRSFLTTCWCSAGYWSVGQLSRKLWALSRFLDNFSLNWPVTCQHGFVIDQWPVISITLQCIGGFDPDKNVWINLLDGGSFVGTFFTYSYMAGCSQCIGYVFQKHACWWISASVRCVISRWVKSISILILVTQSTSIIKFSWTIDVYFRIILMGGGA